MFIYVDNLYDLLNRLRHEAPDVVLTKTGAVLYQMLDALYFVHNRDPPIIYQEKTSKYSLPRRLVLFNRLWDRQGCQYIKYRR